MADWQIGDNLYSEDTGKYYNLLNGQKSYVKSPYETAQDKINQMYEAQRKSQLDALQAQRQKAISGFNQQKQQLAPQYQAQRNQADVTNAQNVTKLRELMAANGINMSGENLTATANMNSSRQNALNDINNQQNQAFGAIDQQIAQVNDPSQEQQINNAVEADRSKALNDAFTQSQAQAYQQATDWRSYQQQLAQQEQARKQAEFEQQQALKAAALQQQQFEWQKQMDQQQLALSKQKAVSSAAKARTSATKTPTVKQKSTTQSYNDGLAYWSNQLDNVRQQGAYRVEQALRNDPAQIQALTNQGYNVNSVIDALYSAASSGKFQSKAAYQKYVDQLNKQVAAQNKTNIKSRYLNY